MTKNQLMVGLNVLIMANAIMAVICAVVGALPAAFSMIVGGLAVMFIRHQVFRYL